MEDYEGAEDTLAKLKGAYLTKDVEYIVWRIANLTSDLIDTLNETEGLLSEAETLLDQRMPDEAHAKLEKASILIGKATLTLNEIEEAVETLCGRLGIRSTADAKARERLAELMERLEELLDRYRALMEELRSEAKEQRSLTPTYLTLACNTTEAFVGSAISLNGTLSDELGQSLPNREIKVYVDNQLIGKTVTGPDGSYELTVIVPYIYKDVVPLKAVFVPVGEDRDVFAGSAAQTYLHLLFYRTSVIISIAGDAHPGMPLTVNGTINVENHTQPGTRPVIISLDDQVVYEGLSEADGRFRAEIRLANDTAEGTHRLVVRVPPNRTFSGAVSAMEILVTRIPINVTVRAPAVTLAPCKLSIRGSVSSELGAVVGASVVVVVDGRTVETNSSANGEFEASINLSLSPFLLKREKIVVHVAPKEPWLSPRYVSRGVVEVNTFSVGLLSASAVMLGLTLYTRLRPPITPEKPKEGARLPEEAEEEETVVTRVERRLEGVRAQLLDTYFSCVRLLSERLGVSMGSSTTLREFLSDVSLRDGAIVKPFSKLTSLAEKALYSPHPIQPSDVKEARKLLEQVRRVLLG